MGGVLGLSNRSKDRFLTVLVLVMGISSIVDAGVSVYSWTCPERQEHLQQRHEDAVPEPRQPAELVETCFRQSAVCHELCGNSEDECIHGTETMIKFRRFLKQMEQ